MLGGRKRGGRSNELERERRRERGEKMRVGSWGGHGVGVDLDVNDVPSKTALEANIPAIEDEKAWSESLV